MLLYSPPDRHCGRPLKAIFHRNAGTIRPAPGRSALLLIGVAIPVYNQNRSRFFGLFAPLDLFSKSPVSRHSKANLKGIGQGGGDTFIEVRVQALAISLW